MIREIDQPAEGRAGLVIPVRPHRPGRNRMEGSWITIVYSVAFKTAAGDMLEEVLVPIAVKYSGHRWRHSHGALRTQIKRALAGLSGDLDTVLERVASTRLAAIGPAHSHNASAHAARRQAISGGLSSTASRLVQPGLFGRTALRTESLPAPAWLDEAPIEDGADRRILWQARVEAVFCGSLA